MAHRIISRWKWICLISVLLSFPATASAQGDGLIIIAACLQQWHRAADLSLGFSMANTTNTPGSESVIPLGLQFGTIINGTKSVGVEADMAIRSGTLAGQDKPFKMFEYFFGPRLSKHARRTTIFGHILAGGVNHWQASPAYGQPSTFKGGGFAMAFGGGFDVNASERIAIRIAQVDWLPIREDGRWIANTVRFGFGVVFKSAK
jgi:hypothetical protein